MSSGGRHRSSAAYGRGRSSASRQSASSVSSVGQSLVISVICALSSATSTRRRLPPPQTVRHRCGSCRQSCHAIMTICPMMGFVRDEVREDVTNVQRQVLQTYPFDGGTGWRRASRWNTLRALRVLRWYDP